MRTKSINCPNCSSNKITMISENLCKCNSCDSYFKVENDKATIVNNNEIHIHYKDSKTSQNDNEFFYVVEKSLDEKTFIRDALLELAFDKETPTDIFTSRFLPSKTFYRKVSVITTDVNTQYSASVGHNKTEKYMSKEKVLKGKDKNGNEIYDYVDVERTRTYTEWSPFSSYRYDTEDIAIQLDKLKSEPEKVVDSISYNFPTWIKRQKRKKYSTNSTIPSPSVPSGEQISKAIKKSEMYADLRCRTSLPGDTYKNYSSSSSSEINSINCYTIPQYYLNYQYENILYGARRYATSDSKDMLYVDKPPKNTGNIMSNAIGRSKGLIISMFCILGLSILLSIIFFGVALSYPSRGAFIAGLIIVPIFMIIGIILAVKGKKKLKENLEEEYLDSQKSKIKDLNVVLKKMALQPLSATETANILKNC